MPSTYPAFRLPLRTQSQTGTGDEGRSRGVGHDSTSSVRTVVWVCHPTQHHLSLGPARHPPVGPPARHRQPSCYLRPHEPEITVAMPGGPRLFSSLRVPLSAGKTAISSGQQHRSLRDHGRQPNDNTEHRLRRCDATTTFMDLVLGDEIQASHASVCHDTQSPRCIE